MFYIVLPSYMVSSNFAWWYTSFGYVSRFSGERCPSHLITSKSSPDKSRMYLLPKTIRVVISSRPCRRPSIEMQLSLTATVNLINRSQYCRQSPQIRPLKLSILEPAPWQQSKGFDWIQHPVPWYLRFVCLPRLLDQGFRC